MQALGVSDLPRKRLLDGLKLADTFTVEHTAGLHAGLNADLVDHAYRLAALRTLTRLPREHRLGKQ